MLPIKKLPDPQGLREYKEFAKQENFTPNYERDGNRFTSYQVYRNAEGETAFVELRKQLLKEQKYVCAYCGQRLSENVLEMKTEHFIPKNGKDADPTKEVEYSNLLACCQGGKGTKAEYCDTKKGDSLFGYIQNPAELSQRDREIIYKVLPKSEEVIVLSPNEDKQKEIDEIISLNVDFLKNRRFTRWKNVVQKRLGDEKTWTKAKVQALRDEYAQLDELGRHKEFKDFILWYLDEKLKHI